MAQPGVLLLFMIYFFVGLDLLSGDAVSQDFALGLLTNEWKNLPPNWGKKNDPCGAKWDGVYCTGSRVTQLTLSSMNLEGALGGDIGDLSELEMLDLSYNKGLTGALSPRLGDLKNLKRLNLLGCGFTGNIPTEIGKLANLTYLFLNLNKFSGSIPPSLGSLSKLILLDLAENQLTGSLPISTDSTPGLDQLLNAKHFHFNKNQLSGGISPKLFSSQMKLIHILLDGNQLTGEIPDTLGSAYNLEILRLDRNFLNGPVPSSINNLTRLSALHLANNQLTGQVPNLTGINSLNIVDLSNNSFDPSEAPIWFSTLTSLNTLVMENVSLQGPVPQSIFSSLWLQHVILKDNQFNDSLDMGNSISQQLKLVDLQDNAITSVKNSSGNSGFLILKGNPCCADDQSSEYCKLKPPPGNTYSTNLAVCGSKSCSDKQQLNPQSCDCAIPYEGTLKFRAPLFSDLSNATVFDELIINLTKLDFISSLRNPFFDADGYLDITLDLFPHSGKYFTRGEIQRIGSLLSNQSYKPPHEFGPYYFIVFSSVFKDERGISVSLGMILGIALGCVFLILVLFLVGVYAVRQKKRAETSIELNRPFASWTHSARNDKDSGSVPQLKGARWFSYDELKKCTNNFLDSNEIGSGGYGKVYRGRLSNGQVVAIKRSQQGSAQGSTEFKTEIELLSRVHHKNLVGLVGFCFEQGEQMLVYEYIPNGTLRDSLSGTSGIYLDWKRRLWITLGSARGLAYLHEHASPPIIHRDVKSTNILLDENLVAKVADFGLSKLVEDAKGNVSSKVKGTMGYLDPEYYMTQQLTEKCDVYSFGVVMHELITSRKPLNMGTYTVREVQRKLDKNDKQHYGLAELMDPNIRDEPSLIGFGKFIELAMQCVEEVSADRPTMSDIVKEMETILNNDEANTNTNPTSLSSSATEFANAKGILLYVPEKDATHNGAFHYSGGFDVITEVEPK